jgi:hypothetical protein
VDTDAAEGLSEEASALTSPHYDEEEIGALAYLFAEIDSGRESWSHAPEVVTPAASRSSGR